MVADFLKRTAKSTTVLLLVFLVIAAAGGLASGEKAAEIAKTVGLMILFWPVLFVLMIPFTLLAKAKEKAARFGASLGRQAVDSPRKEAGEAISEATDEAFGRQRNATAGPARPPNSPGPRG